MTLSLQDVTKSIMPICNAADNRPIIMSIASAIASTNLNIQGHIIALHRHTKATTSLLFPKSFPVMTTSNTNAEDLRKALNHMTASELSDEQIIFLNTLIQNELINVIHFLAATLGKSTQALPKSFRLSDQYKYVAKPQLSKGYPTQKPTVRPTTGQNRQYMTQILRQPPSEVTQTESNRLNDEPDTLYPAQIPLFKVGKIDQIDPTVKTAATPTQGPSDQNTLEIPPNQFGRIDNITIRQKRNKLTEVLWDTIGIASYEEVQRIQQNEEALLLTEKRLEKEVTTIVDKTNAVISSFTEQSSKLAQLYKSEADVQDALKVLLEEERDTMLQLNKLVAGLEIVSDVIVEFSSFQSVLALIPQLITEVDSAIDAILSKTIHPAILPMESVKEKIPTQTKVSMLTPSVRSYMTPATAYIEYCLTEYYPAFALFHVSALPLKHPRVQDAYIEFDIPTPIVGMNSMSETFLYTPGECTQTKGITVCPPSLVQIHTKPTQCVEVLLQPLIGNIGICLEEMYTSKIPPHQRAIYLPAKNIVRIFSPFKDNGSTQCGATFARDTLSIAQGYTDISITKSCAVYTSQLKLVSPDLEKDNTEIENSASVPDMSSLLDDLFSDLSTVHGKNMTALVDDFGQLSKKISTEQKRLSELQKTLESEASIGYLQNFTVSNIDLNKISEPSEILKVVVWTTSILTLAALLFLIKCCCPTCTDGIFNAIIKLFNLIGAWIAHGMNIVINTIPRPRNPTPPPGYDINESLWTNNIPNVQSRQLPLPSVQSPYAERAQYHRRTETVDCDIERLQQRPDSTSPVYDIPKKGMYPVIPQEEMPPPSPINMEDDYNWTIIEPSPARVVLRCRINGFNHTYIHKTGQVYLDFGITVIVSPPPVELIKLLAAKTEALPAVNLSGYREKHGNHWNADKYLNSFYTIVSGRKIHKFGYRIKISSQIESEEYSAA